MDALHRLHGGKGEHMQGLQQYIEGLALTGLSVTQEDISSFINQVNICSNIVFFHKFDLSKAFVEMSSSAN